jgi:D-alanyl-D-alanine dipeptidase
MHQDSKRLKRNFTRIIISISKSGPSRATLVLSVVALSGLCLVSACQSDRGVSAWPESAQDSAGTLILDEGDSDRDGDFDDYMRSRRLVPVERYVPGVVVELRYATKNNITGKRLYDRNARCMLDVDTAKMLGSVQASLKTHGVGLKVWDAYRPKRVQLQLWNAAPKADFVVDPRLWYSKHSSGRAVDVTLVDLKTGKERKMPSDFDDFSEKSRAFYLGPDREIRENLVLLQKVMKDAGFRRINSEWWHFANDEFYNTNIPPYRKDL